MHTNLRKIKACLFDLDGVLVDTAVFHYQAWKRLAATLGFDFTEEQNEELKGISRMESLAKILNWGGQVKSDAEAIELATTKNNWYVEMISAMTPADVLPGARSFLEELKKNDIRIALGSASKNAGLILERTGLTALFDAVVDGNTVSRSKPDPEVFLKGAEILDCSPQACVVFEDAVAGIQAAKNAGMKAIGIGNPEILSGADRCVTGLDKLHVADLEEL
ncbi:beta-phosphoglucomutase [Pedobacter sp. SYP-B3415]|uniref:beta-phosphoglucomutase n=1 Tax=Pedobacter sp. SYP-B3415 TaxID=2496641 RepID=UPI00101B83B8|nr:beta-phosphoglucomutase [Pedobacter sp. SYP-B3415]